MSESPSNDEACQVCGAREWRDLPDPADGRSVTTAATIVDQPLAKAQCSRCGFVQRVRARFLGLTDYYESDYANYYEKPGSAAFHRARYRTVAEWVAGALAPSTPRTILDVGCGQGWAMEAMAALYPDAEVEGIEPSRFNTEVARRKGFVVHEGRVGDVAIGEPSYDLVYCNNVIQHVTEATSFVAELARLVSDGGTIVITCPDGSVPNIELLWADQNFSFLPAHLASVCQATDFPVIRWFGSPRSPSVPPAQMVLATAGAEDPDAARGTPVPSVELEDLYRAKSEYLEAFATLDAELCRRTEGSARVFNLGASYWTSVLAAYCPSYWRRVTACIVDDVDGSEDRFLGAEVRARAAVKPEAGDVLVLGTSPATHRDVESRLASEWTNIVSWDNTPIRF